MNKRNLSLCLALALCLALLPAPAFAHGTTKIYTEIPTGINADGVSMTATGLGSYKLYDVYGQLLSKGLIDPSGRLLLSRDPGKDDPGESTRTSIHYESCGDVIVDLQPAVRYADTAGTALTDDASSGEDAMHLDYGIYTMDGKIHGWVSDILYAFDGILPASCRISESAYFGNDGYLTVSASMGSETFWYVIDPQTKQVMMKQLKSDSSAPASAQKWYLSSVNEGLIAYNVSRSEAESGGTGSRTVYDRAGWMDLGGNHDLSVDTGAYDNWWNFSNDHAMVRSRRTGLYGYIDKGGKLSIPCVYSDGSMFRNGYAFVTNDTGRVGYIDTTGMVAIPLHYDYACGAGDGLFSVGYAAQYGKKYGMVDDQDRQIVPIEYDDISRPQDGTAYAVKDGKLVVLQFTVVPNPEEPDIIGDVSRIFPDVPSDAWFKPHVQAAYDGGIVSGMADGTFRPLGTLTHAQTMVMAANLHSRQKGDHYDFQANKKPGPGVPWYQVFKDYCIAEGILAPGLFDGKEDEPILRGEMAYYFAHTLSGPSYGEKKEAALVDLKGNAFAEEIETLAKADIAGGYEDKTFRPDLELTRAEACVFVGNILRILEEME